MTEKKPKVLFVASVEGHLKRFHTPYFKWFKEHGFEVHATAKKYYKEPIQFCDKFFDIPFERSPFSKANFKVFKELQEVIKKGGYSAIHCHTPMAATLARLAARKFRKNGLKVIYTAHGFHFYNGAPKVNWSVYYPIEKTLAKYTDALITINQEDYDSALKHGFNAKKIYNVPGVGVPKDRITETNKELKAELRKKYGFREEDFILVYPAEFSFRKNQQFLIESLPKLKEKIPHLKLLLLGGGPLTDTLKQQIEQLNVADVVKLYDFKDDIGSFLALSDVAVSSSRQEGLPINLVEAMMTGLPIVATPCRGNNELVVEGENGYLVKTPDEFSKAIINLYQNPDLVSRFGEKSKELVEKFSLENAVKAHEAIYKEVLGI
ncbi:MAG: glycosyltransferase family 4 protein [Muribaculaceae bacterium]|nr:glycosyltransferase family 4 protein [Muribaculaceae bacterium]